MEQSFKKGIVLHLASLVEYSEGGIISKQLIKSPVGNITLFSFDKGEGLSEHSAPFDALVQVLEGSANIVVNGQVFTVNAGESIVFPANAPHALTAIERFKMLLTMIKE
ncbi:cupin domain-containing protein [Bacteroides fragilis]|nr:cupin domain-containing protein [Bacteroides fragilis]